MAYDYISSISHFLRNPMRIRKGLGLFGNLLWKGIFSVTFQFPVCSAVAKAALTMVDEAVKSGCFYIISESWLLLEV